MGHIGGEIHCMYVAQLVGDAGEVWNSLSEDISEE